MVSIANFLRRHARFWSYVVALLFMASPPTPAIAQEIQWIRQFGSASSDQAYGVAVDATGVYVVGDTAGTLPGQASAGGNDAFVRKYDASGTEQWTRQFGTASVDSALGVAVDGTGVYVVGETYGTLPGQTNVGANDAFVRKYDANGTVLWTRQFGSAGGEGAHGLAVDATGVYVVGNTGGTLPGQTSAGASDAFVRKYDANGTVLWTRQFGDASTDVAEGAAVDGTGLYVVGYTAPFQPGPSTFDTMVVKFELTGNPLWYRSFGTPELQEQANAVAIDTSGIYVVGISGVFQPGAAILSDVLALKYDAGGNVLWTTQFGTASSDYATGVAVHASGVYVAGGTQGILPGQTSTGAFDAFVRKYDANGREQWTRQFGTTGNDNAYGVAVGTTGIYAVGSTNGTLVGQTSAGSSDSFVLKLAATSTPTPAVTQGAVWNNASYNTASLSVAPGMIAAVFGTNLTDGSSCVVPSCYPTLVDGKLATTMAGAQVTINGVPVPLFYATPIQLGIQIPTDLTGTSATIQVTVGGQTSVSVTIPVEPFAPGIFTGNQQGTGAGAIHHLDAAGTPVSSQAPARPGEEVDIYCTGLGLVSPPITTGAIPSGNVTVATPTVTVDGVPATVVFSGLSGCCAGIYQVRIRISSAARSGNDIPVVLSIGGKQSNPVTMAVAP